MIVTHRRDGETIAALQDEQTTQLFRCMATQFIERNHSGKTLFQTHMYQRGCCGVDAAS